MSFNILKRVSQVVLLISALALSLNAMAGRVGLISDSDGTHLIGEKAPAFTLKDLSGADRQLSDFKGKYVLVDFWGTWCAPCIEALPKIKKTYAKLDKSKFEVVGICVDCDGLKNFVKENELSWVQLEGDDDVADAYLVKGFPTMFLIDPDGKVVGNDSTIPSLNTHLLATMEAYADGTPEKLASLEDLELEQQAPQGERKKASMVVGEKAPEFEMLTQYGERESITQFRGKYTLMTFWSSGCSNCMANLPGMRDVYHQLNHNDIQFAGVCMGCEDVKIIARENDLDWTQFVALEEEAFKVAEAFAIQGFPTVYLINPEGKVVASNKTNPDLADNKKLLATLKGYLGDSSTNSARKD